MVMTTFTRLGLFKSAEEAIYSGELHVSTTSNEDSNYVPMLDGSSPSLVPVPVPIPIVTEFIKKSLPVVLFSNFLQGADESTGRILHQQDYYYYYYYYGFDVDHGENGKLKCSVCWDCIEGSHQIRVLSNCSHVFHKECLDRWVDEGQLTCPLCRSKLLPPNTNPWVVLRNTHLSDTATEPELVTSY
ncbi:hypothetical protein RHGRI_006144 [Rhododendron griersonianum]|uniref:RING-type domain-containing protein n=1 Tax=Rhododendron griersonianum TaxID=479676 RepID=A0AAV6LFY0_9ERIC|nr:hypothetical protein RHGRI_006141 [Rhododendron griersonianum]KAG5563599.1 hypothetical protein RHGRI_006144 [Rhododendron griersonianum]